jgi:uncharacterized protein YjbI with pentapeptide repeats
MLLRKDDYDVNTIPNEVYGMYQYKDQEYEAVHFEGRDLRYGELIRCVFKHCTFMNASMEEIETSHCRFIECDFKGALMNGSIHTESAFENCMFRGANLFASKFTACKMTGSDFSDAQLDGITLVKGDWSYTNLRHTRLGKQDLRGIRFFEADLAESDLSKADLRDCDLTRVSMSKVKLQGADLRGAILDGIDLKSLDLKGVRMDREQAVLIARSYGAKVD